MAYSSPQSTLVFILITLSLVAHTIGGREIPPNSDTKQPESFIRKDGSVLIPGIGRWMIPKVTKGFNPFTYNPVTGTGGGPGSEIPSYGGTGAGGNSYVPGGDDTLVPNPGVEVPSGGGSTVPTPTRH